MLSSSHVLYQWTSQFKALQHDYNVIAVLCMCAVHSMVLHKNMICNSILSHLYFSVVTKTNKTGIPPIDSDFFATLSICPSIRVSRFLSSIRLVVASSESTFLLFLNETWLTYGRTKLPLSYLLLVEFEYMHTKFTSPSPSQQAIPQRQEVNLTPSAWLFFPRTDIKSLWMVE